MTVTKNCSCHFTFWGNRVVMVYTIVNNTKFWNLNMARILSQSLKESKFESIVLDSVF